MLYPSPSPMLSISFYSDLEAILSSACTFSEINKMESPLNLRSLAWLKRRCSKCFGALREAVRTDNSNWILILSIDANFKWRHFGRTHARSNLGSPPSFAEVPQDFVKQTEAEYNTLKKKSKRPTKAPCASDFKAATEGGKTVGDWFDWTAIIALVCDHDVPLLFADMNRTGEPYFYAVSLLRAFMKLVGPYVKSFGVLYNIGCHVKYSLGPLKDEAAWEWIQKLKWAVSIFHAYAHDGPVV